MILAELCQDVHVEWEMETKQTIRCSAEMNSEVNGLPVTGISVARFFG